MITETVEVKDHLRIIYMFNLLSVACCWSNERTGRNWNQDGLSSWWWPRSPRYNVPTAPAIAVLFPGSGYYSDAIANRDIVLHAYGGGIKRIT